MAMLPTIVEGDLTYLVLMEDAPVHTAENDYTCTDETCPCHDEQLPALTISPCAEFCTHGENCYSVYRADTCEYAHVSYDAAYHYVHGVWPEE